MNKESIIILVVGGIVVFILEIFKRLRKQPYQDQFEEPPNHRNNAITFEEKSAMIALFCNNEGIERIDYIDQRIYRNKYTSEFDCYHAIQQNYMIALYGK